MENEGKVEFSIESIGGCCCASDFHCVGTLTQFSYTLEVVSCVEIRALNSSYVRTLPRRSDKQKITEAFKTRNDISTLAMAPADYNIAPSTFQPVIRESKDQGSRELVMMRWGLIPFFTKELSDVKGKGGVKPCQWGVKEARS